MSSITQWAWVGASGSEAGTLTMWPGAADELALPMQSFAAAHALAEHLQAVIDRAAQRGRAQALDEMARAIEAARREALPHHAQQ